GPMSNVTAKAIEAAVHPNKSQKAFYFVTDKNGDFYFNETLAAHEATIADLKSRDLWLTTPFFE
ncbi:MAG: endolytic transglycosylase MltG, partial [Clostridia bacterium]|nr:endolytic transglycosylase MltG [Clostridia bacterium]